MNRTHMTEDAKRAAKIEKKLKVLLGGYQVQRATYYYMYFLFFVFFKWSGNCNLSNCKLSRKKNSGVYGIRTHGRSVSAAVLYQLSYKDLYIGNRPICWVHLNPWMEWNIWRWCELPKYKFLSEDMIVACMSLETEHRTLSRIFVIVSSSCLLACENALNFERQAKWTARCGREHRCN